MKLLSASHNVPRKDSFCKAIYASMYEMPTSPRATSVLVSLGRPWAFLTEKLCAISSLDMFETEISFHSSHA